MNARAGGRGERAIEHALAACSLVSIAVTVGIVAVLVVEATDFFRAVPLTEFFGDTQWTPLFEDRHFGIWPLVSGTLLTAAIALAVALPCGLLAAIYLAELASPRTRRVLKPALEVLAGVPTIVYGFFALTVVTPVLRDVVPGLAFANALSPGLVMGVMIIPLVSSLAEDAIHAVPADVREAAYALGAGTLAAIRRVILPSAWSGIAAAMILAGSRAIGQTMIVAIAGGQQPNLTWDPREPSETMTAYIVNVSRGETARGTLDYDTIFAVGLTLFVMTLALNVVSYRLARRLRARSRS